jgi:hypothetical protein
MRRPCTLAITLVLSFVGTLQAQSPNASLTGRVTDQSKSVVPDAKVTLLNEVTNARYEGTTNGTGSYYLTDLPVGTYRMEVEKPGFKTVIKPDIILHVQDVLEINFEMALGSTAEAITVEAGAPSIQLTSSTISGVIDSTSVLELPLNGRDWTQLATLQPGIEGLEANQPSVAGRTSGARVNRGYGTQLTISGARPGQNNYLIDGISVNDYLNGGPGSVLGATLGVDAIEEFSVLTSNYSAEYGRTSGGVINSVTRAGTNQFHGDAYEFLRNDVLDAENFFDTSKVPFRRNQFGASGGGPIRKDKLFVFADYEGLRQSLGITDVNTVPNQDARNGIIDNPDGTTTNIGVNPLVAPYLALWHLPNQSLQGQPGDTGIFSFAAQSVSTENFFDTRIDYRISDADTLFGSYEYDKSSSTLPESLNDVLIAQEKFRQLVTLEERHTFSPRLLNSLRVGFNRVSAAGPIAIQAINPAAGDPSLAAVPGWDAPQIFVSGITTFQGGVNNEGFTRVHYNSYQLYDDASFTSGIHSLKFGFSFERLQEYVLQDNTDGGQYSFGSLQAFLENSPSVLVAGLPGAHNPRYYRQSIFGGFVQDDIRWRPNLTFNLGLRYEMSTDPGEIHGELSDMPSLTATAPRLGSLFSNPTLKNFEPRIGLAWDPFQDGKTSVRASFGMYDVLPLIYQYALTEVSLAPFTLQGRASPLPAGSFPTAAFSLLEGLSQVRVGYIQSNPKRNYVMQWNLNLQRELTSNLSATVAYVGSRGVHQLFRADDQNLVLPTLTSAGYLWPSPAGTGTVINPLFGRMDYTDWGSNSFYDALELQIQKRMSHGFQIQGSYTWAKSIDEGSAGTLGDPFNNSISNMFFFARQRFRGLSDYNIGQNLVISYVWEVPSGKSLKGAAEWAAAGWEFGGVFTANSGLPFTPLIGGDPLGGNNSSTYAYPDRLEGSGCQSAVNPGNPNNYLKLNCFALPTAPASFAAMCTPFSAVPGTCQNLMGNVGRNSIPGPGLTNLDFSMTKNNHVRRISENFNVQFRAELFNVFNHPNFLPPNDNNTIFDQTGAPVPGAGLIDATSTTAREIQFGLKLMW